MCLWMYLLETVIVWDVWSAKLGLKTLKKIESGEKHEFNKEKENKVTIASVTSCAEMKTHS